MYLFSHTFLCTKSNGAPIIALEGYLYTLMMLQTFHLIVGSCVGQLLSVTPVSRNVSAGTIVQSTCASTATGLIFFSLTTTPLINGSDTVVTHPNGGIQHTLSFIVPAQHSTIDILCIAVKGTVVDQRKSVLTIQGNPVSECMNKIN